MAEQKKLAWLPLIILILVIVFLLFALITTSLIIVDLKTKELTSQTLHTLEQQRNTFEISLNYELLLTRSVAEEFSKELQLDKNPEKIEKSKRILDLAKDLGTDVVTTHIGVVPADKNHDRYKILQEACGELAEYADSVEAHFAVETGPETSAVLKVFLDSLNSKGVAVNLDPANLVMVTGDDPVKAVYNLKDYIVHTHAKDGIQLFAEDPEIVYGEKKAVIVTDKAFEEVPLGEGKVDWPNYLAALEDIGFKGFLTIEREVGDNPERDIRNAVEFLKKMMA